MLVEKVTPEISLENIPGVILEEILEYVCPNDLVLLCLTSKEIYVHAVTRLYKKITICYDVYFAYTVQELESWKYKFSVVVPVEEVSKLVEVLRQNRKLASLVKSLNITCQKALPYMKKIMPYVELTAFHCMGPCEVERYVMQSLKSLTWSIYSKGFTAPNLVELRILDCDMDGDMLQYENLATSLIELGSYRTLRKLSFEHLDEPWWSLPHTFEPPIHKSWLSFFNELQMRKCRLNLTALNISGSLEGLAKNVGKMLVKVINFKNLQTLELKCGEKYHSRVHRPCETCLLEIIVKEAPQLKNLFIRHLNSCKICQTQTTVRALQNLIPNQLKSLIIDNYNAPDNDPNHKESIWRAILNYQKNLIKLKLYFSDNFGDVSYDVDEFLEANESLRDDDSALRTTIPIFFEVEAPVLWISAEEMEAIGKNRHSFSKLLKDDLFYTHAPENLPLLAEYITNGVRINMKERGICLNERVIPIK